MAVLTSLVLQRSVEEGEPSFMSSKAHFWAHIPPFIYMASKLYSRDVVIKERKRIENGSKHPNQAGNVVHWHFILDMQLAMCY